MKIKYFVFSYVLIAVAGVVFTGCVTQPPPVKVSEEYRPSPDRQAEELERMKQMTAMPDINHINQRLAFYDKRLAEWQEIENLINTKGLAEQRPLRWQECGTKLNSIVQGYESLRNQHMREKGLVGVGEPGPIDPWKVHRSDIQYFEGGCDAVIDAGKKIVGDLVPTKVETTVDMLARVASEGKYEEVIEIYRDMAIKSPQQADLPEVKRIYGMALLRTRRIDAASRVLPQTLQKLDKNDPDTWTQRRLVADLYVATGKMDDAHREYKNLTSFFASAPLGTEWNGIDFWVNDQLKVFQPAETPGGDQGVTIFMTVMRSYLLFDGKHLPESLTRAVHRLEQIFPESKYTLRSKQILWQAEDQVKTWVRRQLYQVDTFVEEKEFAKALAVLDELLAKPLPGELSGEVSKRKHDVILAEATDKRKGELIDAEAVAAQWDEALNLLELRRYDEALSAFQVLLGTEYEDRSREKIIEVSDVAAKRMRRQAAALFVQAKKSADFERKKEMLLESWQMLNQIAVKYPMATILEKVLQNMQVIEDEMRETDPTMVDMLDKNLLPEGQKSETEEEDQQEKPPQKIVEEEIL